MADVFVTRTIKHHVNMGDFSWVEIGASVSVPVKTGDNGTVAAVDYSRAEAFAQSRLDRMVEEDLAEAVRLAEEQSYIENWKA